MNEKEIAEIRRRFKPEKSNISTIRGCYVNDKREIVSEFNQTLSLMPEDESEKFLSLLKRTLSGTLNKNLMDIEFTTQQVVESQEHRLLAALRDSKLSNEEAVQAFFLQTIQSVALEDSYVILLAHDTYDVPFRSRDGEFGQDASSDVFSYILCSVCPVKLSKPALSYYVYENEFHSREADWIVSPPELGFMFPAFDDRSANIYNALYYSRDITQSHDAFVDATFKSEVPMPAAEQKETFQAILGDALAEDCSLEVVQSVHGQLQEMIEEHKVNKEEQPLTIRKDTVTQMLQSNGVSEKSVADFEERFDTEFGAEASLSPRNLVDAKKTEITTPNIKIQVNAGYGEWVETRVINGAKYIMIRVDEEVELDGVPIQIT